MHSKVRFFGGKIVCAAFILSLFLFPMHAALAQDAEGITIQKDVYLNSPILGVENLPDELTVSLYDAAGATVPLATQTFARGEYTLDFDLSKSDGLELGAIARLKVQFASKLNMGDDPKNPTRVKEIWSEVAVNGAALGDRTKVSDETLVRLLLASDASIATYLTLAYEGDDNPIATIYKGLPVSSASGLSAKEYVTSLFSSVSSKVAADGSLTSPYWELLGSNIFYNNGNVGIGTNAPDRSLSAKYSSTSGNLAALPTISVANTHIATGINDFSFSSFEFSGNDGGVVGEFFADGSGFFNGGTPNVYFRATTNHPILLGTNQLVRMIISNTGNVGIGTTAATPLGAYKLAVNGKIGCTELTVTNTGWADFVFQDNYRLPPLEEVETFISENKHLPGIPTEADVKEKGVSVGDMSSKLLQKVEELTLYVIDLKKENESLKGELANIREQIKK